MIPVEGLPGVGPAITRVLQWSGNAGLAEDKDLAQLPPRSPLFSSNTACPLMVPTASGG